MAHLRSDPVRNVRWGKPRLGAYISSPLCLTREPQPKLELVNLDLVNFGHPQGEVTARACPAAAVDRPIARPRPRRVGLLRGPLDAACCVWIVREEAHALRSAACDARAALTVVAGGWSSRNDRHRRPHAEGRGGSRGPLGRRGGRGQRLALSPSALPNR